MPVWLVVTATVIVPGTGHLLLRRYLKGAMLAALYTASLDIFLISVFLLDEGLLSGLTLVSAGLVAGVWAYAFIDVRRCLNVLQQEDLQKRKDDLLRSAQVAWLRDELPEAETLLVTILDMDERDIEAWVHLGKVQKALGREKEARRSFRSALNLAGSDRWHWQLLTELGLAEADGAENEPS
ncbi:MAG TPA: hypothetical protein VMY39_06665 [Planctomycetota bacterium]|nr:hypothetical protein [Planctomycetota bacterium]